MNIFSQKLKIFFLILIIFNTLLSAYWLINGDIHYDVDVSRDFLVMEDIITTIGLLWPEGFAGFVFNNYCFWI